MRWRESAKGYSLRLPNGSFVTVFWDRRRTGWKYVCDGLFSGTFGDLARALDAAEAQFVNHPCDRSACRDVPPHLRGGSFDRGRQHDARSYHEELRRRMEEELRRQEAARQHAEAMRRPRLPSWASVLELPPPGPWPLATVKQHYRRLALQHHPDRGGDTATMARINAAWEQAIASLS